MGSIRLDSLADYDKHGYDLDVMCGACGHKTIIVPATLFAQGLLGQTIREMEKRLRCRKCRARAARVTATAGGPSGGKRRAATWQDKWRSGDAPET